jgi:uncharacterized protein YeaO (DUF488 family)
VIKTSKTVYDEREESDGKRILVMKLWPRGISNGRVDAWMKELGTDRELIRKWKSDEIGWAELSKGYYAGLKGKEGILKGLAAESKRGTVTLLCGCKDEAHCHRLLLKRAIERYL